MPIGAYKLNAIGRLGAAATAFDANFKIIRSTRNPNSNTISTLDNFGFDILRRTSTDLNDQYYIVGAEKEDSATLPDIGIAYVFNTITGNLVATLNNPYPSFNSNINSYDYFGHAVAVSTRYAIVGEYSSEVRGNVYVFNIPDGTLRSTFRNPVTSPSAFDDFGEALDCTDNYAVVGDSSYSTGGAMDATGRAYIYNLNTGLRIFTLENPYPSATSFRRFGWQVALTDQYTAVSDNVTGNVYVYGTTTGNLVYNFQSDLKASQDIDICDLYLAVGGDNTVKVYNLSDGSLRYTLDNPNYNPIAGETDPGNQDYFGGRVSISNSFLCAFAPQEDTGTALSTNQGVNYIFNSSTGVLIQTILNPWGTGSNSPSGAGAVVTDRYLLATGSGYTWAPGGYDPSRAFEAAIVYSRLSSDTAVNYGQTGYATDGYVSPVF